MASDYETPLEQPCQSCGFTTDTVAIRSGGVEVNVCRRCATNIRVGRVQR